MEVCDNYTRPRGVIGGPCTNCGASQPEHAKKESLQSGQLPTDATIANVLANLVLTCSCPVHVVLVLQVVGGEVECPVCKQVWRVKEFNYSISQPANTPAQESNASLVIRVEPVKRVILGAAGNGSGL